MPDIANVTVVCFLASYIVALAGEFFRLNNSSRWLRGVVMFYSCAGFLAHSTYLIVRSNQHGLPPLVGSAHDWFLVLSWLCVLYYLIRTLRDPQLALGVFLYPFVILLTVSAYFISSDANEMVSEKSDRGWAMLHASFLIFGIGGVLLSFITSLMYLFQHYRLKHKRSIPGGLKVPNLEKLARMNWWSVIVSVPLLTLGLASGFAMTLHVNKSDQAQQLNLTDPVVLTSALIWVVMAIFFVMLLIKPGTKSRQVAWMTIWAGGFLLLTMVGLQILLGGRRDSIDTWHSHISPSVRQSQVHLSSITKPNQIPLSQTGGNR
ncbi:Cytochrome C assembly protein [Polystyrenella longa]|uniref:Cytochrome C assembly protein n=1 Tax=Polystyrenella longa TaxID=2528007 RepID=A0A518CNY4_9PLAN|nr:cytochrome c biogenesis protein CcsA [Polystyrenella longa]QDU80904.1 Cytochrome C assembly protein [Polystyrenella longa]